MLDMDNTAGKVAVVTGGASGIGKAAARLLIGRGMQVVIADIEEQALERTAAEIGATGIVTDVSSEHSVQALADEVQRRFGRADLYFSNAGVASTARIEDMTVSDWQWIFGVNVFGVIHGIRSFLPLLRASEGGGHFAVTASIAGHHVTPMLGGYTVSKFAVMALAETLAAELAEAGDEIGLTILCPGPVSTRLGASQRNRPDVLAAGGMVDSNLEATEEGAKLRWIDPESVAGILLRAIARGDLYAFTHPEMAPLVLERNRQVEAALHAPIE